MWPSVYVFSDWVTIIRIGTLPRAGGGRLVEIKQALKKLKALKMKTASFPLTVFLTVFFKSYTTKTIHFIKPVTWAFKHTRKIGHVIQSGYHLLYWYDNSRLMLFQIYLPSSFEYFDETWHSVSLCTHLQYRTCDTLFRFSFKLWSFNSQFFKKVRTLTLNECCSSYGQK